MIITNSLTHSSQLVCSLVGNKALLCTNILFHFHREKSKNILQEACDGKENVSRDITDENGSMDIDKSHNSRTSPGPSKLKERTTIEDFEIIKPISRGAFGRVFLTRKRVTGDLFAIKVIIDVLNNLKLHIIQINQVPSVGLSKVFCTDQDVFPQIIF